MIAGDYAGAERAYRDAARLTAQAGMLEGRQDLPLITTFCLHLVDGRAAEMVEPLAEAHQRGAKWTLDAYALALASAGHVRDARAVAAVTHPRAARLPLRAGDDLAGAGRACCSTTGSG